MSEEKDKQEPMQEKMFNDPETYRRMAEPFPTMANAEAETEAFFEGVAALREQHNIANVYMILKDSAVRDGVESEFFLTGGMGNSLEFESMLAYALGREQSARQARVGRLLKGEGVLHHK